MAAPSPWTDRIGTLDVRSALAHPELLAPPVREALAGWPEAGRVGVAAIDPDLADTAAFCDRYGVSAEESANCVVVAARREGRAWLAACVVLASTRADVNGAVRRHLGARKVSFAAMETAVDESGMEHGGITPVGLPGSWPLLVDAAVAAAPRVVVGSGVRRSKLVLPGAALGALPGAEVLSDLARPLA
jgi:prolyl-tRNA editing enzyme YbaK/EbsC (Cys-tRNA(Pro) deacylase)